MEKWVNEKISNCIPMVYTFEKNEVILLFFLNFGQKSLVLKNPLPIFAATTRSNAAWMDEQRTYRHNNIDKSEPIPNATSLRSIAGRY
ncbi:MAG: hypothetical protein NC221_01415 [Duncaniella sp.]|nr:hypothetical protein [Muribaculum sp.]MCM1254766.1 hypothetical protein [Duncaniella sp.]